MPPFFMLIFTNNDNLIELSDKRYRKQILRLGEWRHSTARDGVLSVTKEKALRMVENFKNKVIENVPVLRGHHTQAQAEANPHLIAGYVEDLELADDGVYAVLNLEDEATQEVGKKYKNVSAAIDESYQDHESGSLMGEVIRHIALVTEPYIKKLDPNFIALSEGSTLLINQTIMASEKDQVEKTDEEVETTEEVATEEATTETTEETTETVETEEKPEETETEETKEEEEVEETTELSEVEAEIKRLQKENKELREREIETEFSVMLSEGKVIPAVKDEYIALRSSSETIYLSEDKSESVSELIKSFVSKLPEMVKLGEAGVSGGESGVELSEKEKKELATVSEEARKKYLEEKKASKRK